MNPSEKPFCTDLTEISFFTIKVPEQCEKNHNEYQSRHRGIGECVDVIKFVEHKTVQSMIELDRNIENNAILRSCHSCRMEEGQLLVSDCDVSKDDRSDRWSALLDLVTGGC
jgi:DNA relaxase NicK